MGGDRPLTDEDYEELEAEAEAEAEAAAAYDTAMADAEQRSYASLQARLDAGETLLDYELANLARLRRLGYPKPHRSR